MINDEFASLASFLERHRKDIHWLIRDAQGLWDHEDVEAEAFVALLELCTPCGNRLDLAVEDDASLLLRHLRCAARRAGSGMRPALHPDQAGSGDDWTPGVIGWDRIADLEGAHPLSVLESAESIEPALRGEDPYHSEVAAWAWLVRRFEENTARIAAFLMISPSWCRECRRRMRERASRQWPLPRAESQAEDGESSIQPWRKFKLPPIHPAPPDNQRELDFWCRPPQPVFGQMWLV